MNKSNQNLLFASVIVVGILALAGVAYLAPSLDQAKEESDVKLLVTDFGLKLKNVPLAGEENATKAAIQENFGPLVTEEVMEQWLANPQLAPGRLTSSPWPERIDIATLSKQGQSYVVSGDIVMMTSAQMASSATDAGHVPVIMQVVKENDKWVVAAYQEKQVPPEE